METTGHPEPVIIVITPMAEADLDRVVEIEQDTLSAWSHRDFLDEFGQPGGVQLVAKTLANDEILGHLCARTGAGEAEIMKLAVRGEARRQGIGAGLLKYFLDFLRQRDTGCCYLELRASNQAALALYKKNGFIQTGFRKKYYSAPDEPAILMTRVIK